MAKPRKPKNTSKRGKVGGPVPHDRETLDQVWALREEGLAIRPIAQQLGISTSAVWRELARDPGRHETLTRVSSEERSQRWRGTELRGLRVYDELMGAMRDLLLTPTGKRRRKAFTATEIEWLKLAKAWASEARQAAGTGTRSTMALTREYGGGYGDGDSVTEDMPEELLIETALKHGDAGMLYLPPTLVEKAQRLLKERDDAEPQRPTE